MKPPGRRFFGKVADGKNVDLFTLENDSGVRVEIIEYGAIIRSLHTPDRNGELGDVVLGFDTLNEYVQHPAPYFGAVVGRYGNRIANGRFTLDGMEHQLSVNDGANHLHGGFRGFDKQVWRGQILDSSTIELEHFSPDRDEGYPGELKARVQYYLTDSNELRVVYRATTTAPTPVNLTQHSYFNLSAGKCDTILDHSLEVNASAITEVSGALIPTGASCSVEGTGFDFRKAQRIRQNVMTTGGIDHNFVLSEAAEGAMHLAAILADPMTGRRLTILTTEPGLQVYTGNFLDGQITGKGVRYVRNSGIALETQHFPDSPNHSHFPSTILRPGAEYFSATTFRFDCHA